MSKFRSISHRLATLGPSRLNPSSRKFSMSQSFMSAIEEETLNNYGSHYYPVRINQIFNNRYEVLAKLGYGGYSTVWLCRDKEQQCYKTVKVCVSSNLRDQEQRIQHHLSLNTLDNAGQYCIRKCKDTFMLKLSDDHHQCYVYEPLGMSLLNYVNLQPGAILGVFEIQWIARFLLMGLDYLHCCNVVHADIKLDNILFTLPGRNNEIDYAILDRCVDAEREDPSPRHEIDDTRTIYTSRRLEYKNQEDMFTLPILCDFGMAEVINGEHEGLIQPIPYRAPEVIMKLKWGTSADIWNVGVLIWELLSGKKIFGIDNERDCLARMISILGPPPVEMIELSPVRQEYFNEQNGWKDTPLPKYLLEDQVEGAAVPLLLDFLKSMLSWSPRDRKTAGELLQHPWLNPT